MIKWFGSRGKEPESSPQAPPEPTLLPHKSLALNVLSHQIRENRKYSILDLGPALGKNLEFFSQFPCTLYIEDLYETLTSFDYFAPVDGFSYEAVYSYLMPYPRHISFDFILAWDLLNYLDREEVRHLILHLEKFARRGTMLFTLIATTPHIPETPTRFRIEDNETLLYETTSQVVKKCPKLEQTDLDHLLPNFRVCNSFLLRNGIKEYLYLYE